MEYLLIINLQLLGVCFHVMQKVIKLGNDFPLKTWKEIFKAFFSEDWDTLIVSFLVLWLNIVAHFIIDEYAPEFRASINYYILWAYGISCVLGYGGQRIVYKYLGSAEKLLDRQSDKLNQ